MTTHLEQPAVDPSTVLDEQSLRAVFDANDDLTIGLEEEVLLLDPKTHAPVPLGDEIVREAADPRVKRELPACQVELLTRPHAEVEHALIELTAARAQLLEVCGGAVAPAACAVHPSCSATATSDATRHQHIADTYGEIARRQLVGALQVHVALGSADRTLAVYNAMRGYLPELAALAAAAPFYEGRDTGLASVRPVVCGQLPRQGVPPPIDTWAAYAADLRWGVRSGCVPEPRQWWWELRPHVVHGTIEVRVPDVQATMGATAAIVRVVHALVSHLDRRAEDGQPLPVPATWRIAENRWSALRGGVHGTLADLDTGTPMPTARRLRDLLDEIEPCAQTDLDVARRLTEGNGADALRAVGIRRATASLVEAFGQ